MSDKLNNISQNTERNTNTPHDIIISNDAGKIASLLNVHVVQHISIDYLSITMLKWKQISIFLVLL